MRHPWRLLIGLAIVVGLLVVADRVAASVASGRVADRIQKSEHVAGKPDVTIHGFPFLTQAIGGTYDDIEVKIDSVHASTGNGHRVSVERVTTHLHGVHIPLGDAFDGKVQRVHIDRAEAAATVTYGELNQALSGTGIAVHPAAPTEAGGPPLVDVTAKLALLGQQIEATAICEVSAVDGGFRLAPHEVHVSTGGGGAAISGAVSDALQLTVQLPRLPFRVEVRGVEASAQGVVVHAAVEDVVVAD